MRLQKIAIPVFCAAMTIACTESTLHAQSLLVDDFSTDIPETDVWASFPASNALGGHVGFTSPANRITYSVSGGVLRARNDELVEGYLTVSYDGASGHTNDFALPDVDLTAGGKNTHLLIKVSSLTTSEPHIGLRVRVMTGAWNYSYHSQLATGPGTVAFPLGNFSDDQGAGGDEKAAKSVVFVIFLEPGDEIEIDSWYAGSLAPAIAPDTESPSLRFLKKSRLKTPRARHKFKGTASDNDAVAKVEVKSRLRRGWRKAKLRASGRWIHRTPRLGSGRNKFKVRAWDESGNRSRVKRVKAVGR